MAIAVIFLLGVMNFALHGAVLGSGHSLLGQSRWFVHLLCGAVPLGSEFLLLLAALLLAALLLAAFDWTWVAWAYLGYSALNALGAWLILTRRV